MGNTPSELDSLCRAEWPRLVGSLTLVTGDADLATDLAQEALARLCRDWPAVSRMDAPGAWAHLVAMNLARSHFRRRAVARRRASQLEPWAMRGSADHDDTTTIAVRAAVAQLPERERIVIALRYFADLSVQETAHAMRCPEGTVKTLTRRAVHALRAAGLIHDVDDDADHDDAKERAHDAPRAS